MHKNSYGYQSATINGGTASGAIDLLENTLIGLRIPASMSGTLLTFKAAEKEDGTYIDLYDKDNAQISVTIGTSARHYQLDPVRFAGVRFLKIISSATETSKTLTLVTRPI